MLAFNMPLFAQSNIFDGITEEGLKLYQSRELEIKSQLATIDPQLLDIANDPNSELDKRKMFILGFRFRYWLKISDKESEQIAKIVIAKKYNKLNEAITRGQSRKDYSSLSESKQKDDEDEEVGIITSTFIKNIQKYRELNSFHDSLACVLRDGKYGYINLKGEEVIPCIYTYAQDFSNGVACVTINGKESFIDTKGKTTSPKYSSTKQKQSLILKQHNKKYGYVDLIGNVVIPYKYDGAKDFSEGLAAVRNITYIDGAEVFSAIDDEVDWGFIDEKGKVVIPFKYSLPKDERALFSEGVVIVKKSGLFGYINREGKQITPCKYEQAQPFSNGYAFVELEKVLGEQGNKQRRAIYKGYVDKNGKEALVQCEVKEGTITYMGGMKYVDFSNY